MGEQLELAKKRLFDSDSLNTGNIKLFPGTDRDTTPEQIAEEINKAISQIEAGDSEIVDSFEE
ncbi:MAG: hypothetical protein KDI13_00880 [Alphaproteobacteria bacterium]|nr:hypothetical protein [Alphaproteobacteria bacterium]